MPRARNPAATPRVASKERGSSFPATLPAAAAPRVGPGWRFRWHGNIVFSSGAHAAARLRLIARVGCIVAAILTTNVLRAEPLTASSPATYVAADPFTAFIAEASRRFAVPERWIRAVMRVESGGDPRAVSPKGAMGLMQIMPATWAALRSRHGLGADPFDTRDNILAGAAYLAELHARFGAPGFLAAYNAGPAHYAEHLATGRPLPAETRAYLAALGPMIGTHASVVPSAPPWREAPLFAEPVDGATIAETLQPASSPSRLADGRAVVDLSALAPQSGGLFVRRGDKVQTP